MRVTKAPRTLTLLERKAFRNAYRGKVLLDQRWPELAHVGADDWPKHVTLERFDMARSCGCMLGHTLGNYWQGIDRLWPMLNRHDACERSVHYGFNQGREAACKHVSGFAVDGQAQVTNRALQRAWTYILRKLGR